MTPNNQEVFVGGGAPNRTVVAGGRAYLFFSGTAYLGLPANAAFQALVADGQRRFGTAFGSSRNGNFQLDIYQQAEHQLAQWTGAAAALTLSSGMLAGQAVVRQLWAEDFDFLYAPGAHPALWHLPTVSLPSSSFDDWVSGLKNGRFSGNKTAILTNSLDALRGQRYNFDWVNDLPADQNITLVVDDSHGIGTTGAGGAGIFGQLPQRPNVRVIVTASLHKAMGIPGGLILSDAPTSANIRQSAYFSGCSPVAPAYLWAYTQAAGLYAEAMEKLNANAASFYHKTKNLGIFENSGDFPVFYTLQDGLYQYLLAKNALIYSFSYPEATSKRNTRVVLSAWHTPEDVEKLADLCAQWLR